MDDVLHHRFFDAEGGWRMSALHVAAALNDTAEVKRILDAGAVPADSIEHLLMKTPNHLAAEALHADVVEILLGHGATPDERDVNERTPMHALVIAAGNASSCPEEGTLARLFDMLGAASADIDGQDVLTWKDRQGRTPLALACASPNPIVKKLYS